MKGNLPVLDVAGAAIHMVTLAHSVELACQWLRAGERRTICHVNAHGVVLARQDVEYATAIARADLVAPDGMPLVWLGQRQGHDAVDRVYGPDFMTALLERTSRVDGSGPGHFLFGTTPATLDALRRQLQTRHPGIRIVGVLAPPFGPWDDETTASHLAVINQSGADIIWVGLGTPRQEKWMARHRSGLDAALLIGVGAAFDFISGVKPQAPRWMRQHGLEWLFRLVTEPIRLGPRYFGSIPRFLALTRALWRR